MRKNVLRLVLVISVLAVMITIGTSISAVNNKGDPTTMSEANDDQMQAGAAKPTASTDGDLFVGKPAITPSKKQEDPNRAAYTRDEALAYAKAHPVQSLDPKAPVHLMFEGFQPVRMLMWLKYKGIAPDRLIASVRFTGVYALPAPGHNPYPADLKWKNTPYPGSTTFDTALQVYDAHTGNLLVETISPESGNVKAPLRPKPEIEPRFKATSPGQATFTQQDVQNFLRNRGYNNFTDETKPDWVKKIDILTGTELLAKYHEESDRPNDVVVCIVIIHGKYLIPYPPYAPGEAPRTTPPYAEWKYYLFDAQTGYLTSDGLSIKEPGQ